MNNYVKNWFKFVLGFIVCLLIRLIQFRPPNIEPIMATALPFGRAYGKGAGFLFPFASMVLFDLVVGKVGVWTLITALAYGFVGLGAAIYLQSKKNTAWNYAKFAIISTLFFDAVTGLTVGPLFFGQSLTAAFFGQIPFTTLHLLGNVSFALVLSPALYAFVIENKRLELPNLFINLNPKHA
ncbi:MAG: DUF6580 family putative transport protein [Candidatus Paceibacterota bacterium]